MDDATLGPQRMRYSVESRCRAVAAMVAGKSPGAAAQAEGASRATGYRWWQRYTTAGWAGLQERPSTPQHQPRRLSPAAEAEILAARQRSGAGAGHPRGGVGAPRLDRGQGAAAVGPTPAARALHGPQSCAMSAPSRGSCCTWTPRSWGASGTSASASPAMG